MTSVQDWAAPNPVTENRSGVIGKGVDRYEGALKVTGTAPYAYDTLAPSPPAIGVLVTATIPRGNRVKEGQRRAFRFTVGRRAFSGDEGEHQRAPEGGQVGTTFAAMPRKRAHAILGVCFVLAGRLRQGAVDAVHQGGTKRGRKVEQQPAIDHADGIQQRRAVKETEVQRNKRDRIRTLRRTKARVCVPRGQADLRWFRRLPERRAKHAD